MKIKVIKSYNDKIWYSSRVGQVFECSRLKNGYLVNSAAYLFINEKDGEVVDSSEEKTTDSAKVIGFLSKESLSNFELHEVYEEVYGEIDIDKLNKVIQYLRKTGKVKRSNIRVKKNNSGMPCSKWELV